MGKLYREFDVYINNKKIDTVFYNCGMTVAAVRRQLIEHDGYSPMVVVRAVPESKTIL